MVPLRQRHGIPRLTRDDESAAPLQSTLPKISRTRVFDLTRTCDDRQRAHLPKAVEMADYGSAGRDFIEPQETRRVIKRNGPQFPFDQPDESGSPP